MQLPILTSKMQRFKHIQQQWKTLILGYRFIQLVKAPYGDFAGIGRLSQAINDPQSLQQVVEFLSQSPQGQQALQERPRLGNVDLRSLHQLPSDTLGYIYADQMLKNGFSPPNSQQIADNPYTFLGAHLGETHDIWHVVTGCDTNKAGEIALQAFYIAQIYPSRFWIALLCKNLLKTALEDLDLCSQHMDAVVTGWLLGKQARPLFGIDWKTLWEVPLATIQSDLNLLDKQSNQESFAP